MIAEGGPPTDGAARRAGTLCRACGWRADRTLAGPGRCPDCRAPRLIAHPELFSLSIGHVDCDAFYAAVEKRDRPELRDQPLIIGGGDRGVVTTACYLARIKGVRSAMPMARARALCPEAVVLKPEMSKYAEVSRRIRALFETLTPAVEPLSLDEAFLDLGGTERVHGMPPAAALSALARRIEAEIGVTVSIGLSWNKFLAKIASDLDKPRGFAAIGAEETLAFLEDKPVSMIWGVGSATEAKLQRDGFRSIGDLRRAEPSALERRYGAMGLRLARLSRGQDARTVAPGRQSKSLSAETTFSRDLSPGRAEDLEELDRVLWRLSERASARMKAAGLMGRTAHLTLKRADHTRLTRRRALGEETNLAARLYRTARMLLDAEIAAPGGLGAAYRLIGVGFSDLTKIASKIDGSDDATAASTDDRHFQESFQSLLDPGGSRQADVERAVDDLRERFGPEVVQKGRGFTKPHTG